MTTKMASEIRDEFLPGFLVLGDVVSRFHLLDRQVKLRPSDDVVITEALRVGQDLTLDQ